MREAFLTSFWLSSPLLFVGFVVGVVVYQNQAQAGGVAAIADETSRIQVQTLDDNCRDFGVVEFTINDVRQGIVHVVGPEQGLTLPGMTVVCGDSHTSTHGAFGALAHGIGTSEVEHVLATQTLLQQPSKTMEVRVEGVLPNGITAKDVILAIIGKIGTAGGTGYVIEFTGSVIRGLSMEGRMTVCNMTIEGGARAGLISPDEKTFEYLKGRPYLPKDKSHEELVAGWKQWASDPGCTYDTTVILKAEEIEPQVTWGTSPGMVRGISARTPTLSEQCCGKDQQFVFFSGGQIHDVSCRKVYARLILGTAHELLKQIVSSWCSCLSNLVRDACFWFMN